MSAVGGACDGAIGNANMDARGRGVAVADRSLLAEVDARGTGVGTPVWSAGRWAGLVMGGLQDKETERASL